jgi:hypothetical protein
LDVNGSMRVSGLPRWRVNFSYSSDINTTGVIKWNRTEVDNKNAYSSATGLYTVQEAGHYYIYCAVYQKYSDNDAEIGFIINGNNGINRTGNAFARGGRSSAGYDILPIMSNLELNVNDTVGVHINLAGVHHNQNAVSYFGGYKVC